MDDPVQKGCHPGIAPPTSDAARYHIKRAHLQSLTWKKAIESKPEIPEAAGYGWKIVNEKLVSDLTSLSLVPDACVNLIRCSCKGTCITLRCGCKK